MTDPWLQALQRAGALRAVDQAFAQLLRRLGAGEHVQAAGALALRAVSLGHAGIALDQLARLFAELDAESVPPPDEGTLVEALQDSALVSALPSREHPLCLQHGVLALNRYACDEAHVACEALARIGQHTVCEPDDAGSPKELEAVLRRLFALQGSPAADLQALAAWTSLAHRLFLLTGGPGTGKTTTVARLLALHLARNPALRVALAAPTGRAAARLVESIRAVSERDLASGRLPGPLAAGLPTQAATLHRLLGWSPNGWRHGEENPLAVDLIVIDEASMIDLPLMARLMQAVPAEATLVLLGDPSQLPAVDAGDVFGALCEAPALQPARVHLVQSHRQADTLDIAPLAAAVHAGDVAATLAFAQPGALRGVHRHPADSRVLPLLEALGWIGAWRTLAELPPEDALAAATQRRVLGALRRGGSGVARLNAAIEDAIAGPQREVHFAGRLLMISHNDVRLGLYNGDVGVAAPGADGEMLYWFAAPGGGLRALRPSLLPAHEPAFATTVHKAQGSEFEHVLCVLDGNAQRLLSRELLYTAITRARRSLHLVASDEVLGTCVHQSQQRFGALRQRLAATRAPPHPHPTDTTPHGR